MLFLRLLSPQEPALTVFDPLYIVALHQKTHYRMCITFTGWGKTCG